MKLRLLTIIPHKAFASWTPPSREKGIRSAEKPWGWTTSSTNAYDPGHGWRNNGRSEVSRIFNWYSEDYTGDHSVQKILKQFGPAEYRTFFEKGGYSIRYKSYDWGLNDQGNTGDEYRHNPLRSLF